jgi:hypothetical protein
MANLKRVASGQVFVLKGHPGPAGEMGPMGPMPSVDEIVDSLLANDSFIEEVRESTESGEDIVKKLLSSDEFRRKLIGNLPMGGLGISPTVVNNIANRVTTLENTPSTGIKYSLISSSGLTTVLPSDLIFGTNILGVNAPGDVEISLPETLTTGTIITVRDEKIPATNTITITTYKVN